MSISSIKTNSNYETYQATNLGVQSEFESSSGTNGKVITISIKPSEIGYQQTKAPKTVRLTDQQIEEHLLKYFGLNVEEAKKRLSTDNPFKKINTTGDNIFTYNSKTGKFEAKFNVEKGLYDKLAGRAKQLKKQIDDEKKLTDSNSPSQKNASRDGIDNASKSKVDLQKLADQAEVLTSKIGIPTDPNELKPFAVTLSEPSKLSAADNALLSLIKRTYSGGNLEMHNFREILSLAKDSGVKVQNLKVDGQIATFDLSIEDILKLKIARIAVQEKANRVEKIYRDAMDNNEVSAFIRGVVKGGYNSVAGTVELLVNFPETVKTLLQVVGSPIETFNALYKELGETWDEFKQADSSKKAEMIGELVGEVIVGILLGKGIGKLGNILKATKTGNALIEKANVLKAAATTKLAEKFSDEAAKLASQRAKRRLATQVYGGIPADVLLDMAIVAGNKLKNGAVKFANFSKQMVDDFGEKVKPYLEKMYREKMTELGLSDKIDEIDIKKTSLADIERRSAITASNVKDVIVPTVRSGKFSSWFNSLSKGEIETLWTDKTLRTTIESRLRHPGGFHEWLPVSRTPKFKAWGIKAEQIWEWRNETKNLRFVNPPGRHGGIGSGKAHNEMFALIDQANSFEEFKSLLREWASRRLPNGVNDLPKGLRK